MTQRADPSAAGTDEGLAFEPFHLEREAKSDGRAILFYTWPGEPAVPDGVGDITDGPGTSADANAPPDAEPWSPQTQPTDQLDRDA